MKFSLKKSLAELTVSIQKQMVRVDEHIRKNMEELNGYKGKITAMSKKDTGSLQVRDFTDDIYMKKNFKEYFIEGSEMFQDVLIVLAQDKQEAFKTEVNEIMQGYY